MKLSKESPLAFCKSYLRRELEYNKSKNIQSDYWEIIERMIERADELKTVFNEIVSAFGYTDKYEGVPPENSYVWLLLEHIWLSADYARNEVVAARGVIKDYVSTRDKVIQLSMDLSEAIRKLDNDFRGKGLSRSSYQTVPDMMREAGRENGYYLMEIEDEFDSLVNTHLDDKYWPERADLIDTIHLFESIQPDPAHELYPIEVINGRASDVKDFVLTFYNWNDGQNELPTGFRFSNQAFAEIINVVLDRSPEELVTAEAVKNVRNKYDK